MQISNIIYVNFGITVDKTLCYGKINLRLYGEKFRLKLNGFGAQDTPFKRKSKRVAAKIKRDTEDLWKS